MGKTVEDQTTGGTKVKEYETEPKDDSGKGFNKSKPIGKVLKTKTG